MPYKFVVATVPFTGKSSGAPSYSFNSGRLSCIKTIVLNSCDYFRQAYMSSTITICINQCCLHTHEMACRMLCEEIFNGPYSTDMAA